METSAKSIESCPFFLEKSFRKLSLFCGEILTSGCSRVATSWHMRPWAVYVLRAHVSFEFGVLRL